MSDDYWEYKLTLISGKKLRVNEVKANLHID
jgi:hypothetical protein